MAAAVKTGRVFVHAEKLRGAVDKLLDRTGWSGALAAREIGVGEATMRAWRIGEVETITRRKTKHKVIGMNRSTLDSFIKCYHTELGTAPVLTIFER